VFLVLKVLLWVSFCSLAFASTYVRPVPYIPTEVDPLKTDDVVSINLIRNVHLRMFELATEGKLLRGAVESFKVSNNQLKYSFTFKKIKFHSGKDLTSDDIIYTFHRSLSPNSSEFQDYLTIQGVDDFSKGKRASIVGISKVSAHKVEILLNKPDPNFLRKLSNIRLSILNKEDVLDGLGAYSVKKMSLNQILIQKRNQKLEIVKYEKASKKKALKGFRDKQFHDLFYYKLNTEEKKSIQDRAYILSYRFPRSFALFLNSNRMGKKQRVNLSVNVDNNELVSLCIDDGIVLDSIVPKGFIGYSEQQVSKREAINCPKKEISIFIPEGLGNEVCILKYLKDKFNRCDKISFEKVPFNMVLDGWKKNKLDGYIGYIEAETTVDFYGHFYQSANFFLGDINQNNDELIENFRNLTDLLEKKKIATKINNNVLSGATMKPLYVKKIDLIYSNSLKKIQVGHVPPSMIGFDSIIGERK